MTTRSGCISANSQRRECSTNCISRGGDEWPVDKDLQIIVGRIKCGRLLEKQWILDIRIPFNYITRLLKTMIVRKLG